mgnify:CR=1 FL=1
MTSSRSITRLIAAVALAALLVPLAAQAHKVGIYGYMEGGKVQGRAYFAGGGKAVNSPIQVSDGAGQVLGDYTTDSEGNFSFPLPAGVTPPLKLVLKASQGHQASHELSAEELGLAGGKGPAETTDQASATAGRDGSKPAVAANLSRDDVRQVVEQALQAQLAPLNAQVARLAGEREVTVHDIAAGIGYIIGLMGMAAWFMSRRKRD